MIIIDALSALGIIVETIERFYYLVRLINSIELPVVGGL